MQLFWNLVCWKDNKYEEFTHWYWNKKHHNVKCHICGEVLDSTKTPYSPEECGWVNIGHDKWSRKKWICHMCDAHRNFPRYIKLIDLDEEIEYCSPRVLRYPWEKMIDKRNQILKEIQDQVLRDVTTTPIDK